MKLASVVLDIPTQALDEVFSYLIDETQTFDMPLEVGCAVLVDFGSRRAIGFVVQIDEYDEAHLAPPINPAKLKPVQAVLTQPFFDEEGAACARWLSEHYVAPLSSCVRLFTPPGGVPRMMRSPEGVWVPTLPVVGEVDDRWVVAGPAFSDFVPKKSATRQIAILDALRAGEVRVAELTSEFGSVASSLKALEKKGAIEIQTRRRFRGEAHTLASACDSDDNQSFVPSKKPSLTAGQAEALDVIKQTAEAADGQVVVVDGVTGSGKTEVYLQAIEAVLARGRSACVLVPEISLTPQTVGRFRGRFGNTVAVIHSRMSQGERFDQWEFIRSGKARVVVGARSALFTPLSNVGLYIIDEEHEGSYKQDSAPRYHARDVALMLAKRSGAAVVLGSATPSIEALYACAKDDSWHQVCLPERANGNPLPEIRVVDMAQEFSAGSRSMFSAGLTQALVRELGLGHKAVLLLNQRGFAQFVLCRECGFVPSCPSCSTSLTFHERGNYLICHHCGYKIPALATCPECKSPYLKKFGAGTQRVEAELRLLLDSFCELIGTIPIVRMDADTTSGKGAHHRLLDEFAQSDAAVLLGTQMIAKGLDFKDVTLVGVINADTMLNLPDYRASERTFDLIEQVAGRAGRAHLKGEVIVQTYEAQAAPIQAAATYDRTRFLRDELPKRKMLGYPPYVRMANVLVWGKNESEVQKTALALQVDLIEQVRNFGGDAWQVLPATPCVLSRLRGSYRWHVVVKCPRQDNISAVLEPYFRARTPQKEVHVAVDIDPDNLL